MRAYYVEVILGEVLDQERVQEGGRSSQPLRGWSGEGFVKVKVKVKVKITGRVKFRIN